MQIGSPVASGVFNGYVPNSHVDWSEFTICDYKDIPGQNIVTSAISDMPALVENEIRYPGQPLLLVAHSDRDRLQEAASNIILDITSCASVLDLEQAIITSEPVFTKTFSRGNTVNAFAQSEEVFQDEYFTQAVDQAYLEPQIIIACSNPNKSISIKGSMQCPFYVQKAICTAFNLPPEKVEVIQITTGGAFGGKEEYPSLIAVHAALLSWKAGKTVKIRYDRQTDLSITTKRHPSKVMVKIGVDGNKKIQSFHAEMSLDAGAYLTLSPVVLARGILHLGAYSCENVKITGNIYITNHPPRGAFRGFGAPQAFFAVENHIDKICSKLNIDPLEFRKKNCFKRNSMMPTGQKLESCCLTEILEKILVKSDYLSAKKKNERFNKNNSLQRRGIGISLFYHGCGFTGSGETDLKSIAGLKLDHQGNVYILSAAAEIGQGAHTVLPQIVSEELNLPLEKIFFTEVNTLLVPNSGPTVASRTTMIVGELLRRAAEQVKQVLGKYNNVDEFKLKVQNYFRTNQSGVFYQQYQSPSGHRWDDASYQGNAYSDYSWAGYLVWLTVDLICYAVHIEKVLMICDIGKLINKPLVEGQLIGGIAQAIGFSLMENSVMSFQGIQNNSFSDYLLPTIKDLPEIELDFVDNPSPYGPFGAKGVGELPLDGLPPAIANAVADAVGVRIKSLPITPEKILSGLESENKNKA
ncbi:MAG: xanthine dehydrogenase family protein molybdopterin-binding subunit [bacterium]